MRAVSKHSRWLYPLAGAACGILYTLLDEGVLDQTPGLPGWTVTLHEFLDFMLPMLLGASFGACLYFIRRERRLSSRLSLKFDRLRQDLLFNTLISQMLHEIQNPLHNLTTALDEESSVPAPTRELVRRNLARLAEIKTRYGQWGAVLDNLDPEEPVDLREFVQKFVDEKIAGQLRQGGVAFHASVPPARAYIHPVFLEQILAGLLTNALSALEGTEGRRQLSIQAQVSAEKSSVVLRVVNSGAFPPAVLEAQGRRPSPSKDGLGLGLLLTRTLLEQVGGSLALFNEDGCAVAAATMRGEPL